MIQPAPILCLVTLVFAPAAGAALYTNNFNGEDAVAKFPTENTDVRWSVGNGVYTNSYTGADTASSAGLTVGGVSGNTFTLSSQFSVKSTTAPTNNSVHTVGMGFLGEDANFVTNGYFADFGHVAGGTSAEGNLRLIRNGQLVGTSGFYDGNADSTSLALTVGAVYSMRITGTYNASNHLILTFGIYDETGTTRLGTSATFTDTAPLGGDYFGYRNRTGGGSTSAREIAFDNFSLESVPEPSALALCGLSALVMLRRRR